MTEIDLSIPEAPHNIAEDAYHLYGSNEPGIRDEEASALQRVLDAMYPDLQEAYRALLALTAFSLFVKHKGDADSADRLMKLVRDQAPHFEEVKHQVAETNEAFKEQFAKLAALDTAGAKTAPKIDEQAPKDSLKVSSLLPNPALRPPPRRK